jgi:adenine-specific DNA-methyltransferase
MTHEPQNPALQSPDHRLERLEAIKRLYPDLFTDEGKLNVEEVHALAHDFDVSLGEKFEFRWPGKMHAKKHAFTPSKARLAPDMERSVDFDKTQNVIIEGENLEVLKLLSKAYYNKVKCIYIDPPYNTGHDFVYSDDYSEGKQAYWEKNGVFRDGVKMDTNTESAGRYHTNWLNMMMPRLLLAQMMLRDDGLIFVSIDDNELHNLRKLMDEVFGEENFIAKIVWEKRFTRSNNSKLFATLTESVLLYRKSDLVETLREPRSEKADSTYSNPDNDARGVWTSVSYVNPATKEKRPNLAYSLANPITGAVVEHPTHAWKYERSTYEKHVAENRLYWGLKGENTYPRLKRFLSEMEDTMVPVDLWSHEDTGTTDEGSKILEGLLGVKTFDFPKPPRLIERMLKIATKADSHDIFMDFFAGSGTAGHALLNVNKEDAGTRRFVLVQIPEATDEKSESFKAGYKKISDITIERVKRAGQNISSEDSKVDTGFKVFRLTTSIFPENTYQPDPEKSEDENVKAFQEHLARAKQQLLFDPKNKETDLQYEMLIKQGFTLTMSKEKLEQFADNAVWKVTDGDHSALVCLDADLKKSTIKALEGQKDIRFIGLHRAVDTTRKWELTQIFGESLVLF